MKREDQVCSTVLARKLFDLGVKADSLYRWYFNGGAVWEVRGRGLAGIWEDKFPAYTVAELGEMLPAWLDVNNKLTIQKTAFHPNQYEVWYCHPTIIWEAEIGMYADTMADVFAKMLCWLIENGKVKA